MYLKSFFPDPQPVQDMNAHDFFFGRPEQSQWPEYNIHIDIETDRKRTFKEVEERIKNAYMAFGSSLKDGGMEFSSGGQESGEVVGIMSENSSDYMVLVHALIANTTPFALISAYSTRFELLHAFKLSKLTRLFVQPKHLHHALSVAREIGLPSHNIYVIGGRVQGHQSLSGMIERARKSKIARFRAKPVTKNTLAYLVFSSGTSGLPKAVMITHGNLLYSLFQIITRTQISALILPPLNNIPVCLAFLPMHHTYGLHVYCFQSLLAPSTIAIMPKWDINAALKAIPKYRVTNLPLIPSLVHQLLNHPRISSVDLSSIATVSSGAAYLPPPFAAKLKGLTPKESLVAEGYGMSECTISALTQLIVGTPLSSPEGQPRLAPAGSTGILIPGMQARLVREDGSEAEYNEVGELWLKGANVSPGYWGNEQATRETFVDGWLRTGDRFSVNNDGCFLYVVSFLETFGDTLKVSGIQVSPVEIENVLLAHPEKFITDVTVAGVFGHGRTDDEKVPRAWVVLSAAGRKKDRESKAKGEQGVVDALDEWQKENLSKYKWTRGGIEIVKEIPKSPTGKVLRRILVDRYEQNLQRQKRKRGHGVKSKL
ncbi:amp dependent CoA ligase [Lentinula novae-zelandiae]|nr:amp dependent CoA ligase [Lentinula novae-zelandiae]